VKALRQNEPDRAFTQERLKRFVEIKVTLNSGNSVILYGGDQAWFKEQNGIHGGCGTVAAANLLAYFRAVSPSCLPAKEDQPFEKNNFLSHMEEVYNTLTPWSTGFLAGRTLPGIPGGMPVSLGIYSPRRFARAVTSFAMGKNVVLKPAWPTSDKGAIPCSLKMPLMAAVIFIEKALGKGFPLAMLNYSNKGLLTVTYYDLESGKTCITDRFQWHWVVITGIKRIPENGHFLIETSSWGNRVTLDLNEFWKKGLTSLVYFEPK
jgi:hypothetical protein